MNNRAKAAGMVSDHCRLECLDRHGKGCSNACFYDLVNRVEEILNKRDTEPPKEGGGEE